MVPPFRKSMAQGDLRDFPWVRRTIAVAILGKFLGKINLAKALKHFKVKKRWKLFEHGAFISLKYWWLGQKKKKCWAVHALGEHWVSPVRHQMLDFFLCHVWGTVMQRYRQLELSGAGVADEQWGRQGMWIIGNLLPHPGFEFWKVASPLLDLGCEADDKGNYNRAQGISTKLKRAQDLRETTSYLTCSSFLNMEE